MRRFLITAFLCGLLGAQTASQQTPPPATNAPQTNPDDLTIRTTVQYVSTPAWVYDRDGNIINGLRPEQFRVFDNGKEQNPSIDVSYTPISMVICIQANSHVEHFMPQLRRLGKLVKPLLIGDQGEAAVITYHARVTVAQDFTSDADKIDLATSKIFPGSETNRLIDAVSEATRMLRSRPKNRQRVILLIGETRDIASETRLRSALMDIQVSNITFFAVDMSRFITTLTAKAQPGRPETRPAPLAGAASLPSMMPPTPNTVAQATGNYGGGGRAEFVPMLVELFRDAKAIFKDNPVEAFTKATGGHEYGFSTGRSLEDAIQQLGDLMHSDYMISYSPNNREETGWHDIKVDIPGRPDVKRVITRPGYWLGAK